MSNDFFIFSLNFSLEEMEKKYNKKWSNVGWKLLEAKV